MNKVENLIESLKSNNKYCITNVKQILRKVLEEMSDDSGYFNSLSLSLPERAELVVRSYGSKISEC